MRDPARQSTVCPWWLVRSFDNPLRKVIQNPQRMLGGFVTPGSRIVDLGCGIGYFTIPLAKMVGAGGLVYAVDLQEKMLAGVRRRAESAGVVDRIRLHQCTPESIGVQDMVDFLLAFWMVHEVPDRRRLLTEIHGLLRQGGQCLIAEPPMHVSDADFAATRATAKDVGFQESGSPKLPLCRTVLLSR